MIFEFAEIPHSEFYYKEIQPSASCQNPFWLPLEEYPHQSARELLHEGLNNKIK